MSDKQSRVVCLGITTRPVNITRSDLIAHARREWEGHDPGDEDEPSWLTAPAPPDSTFMHAFRREVLGEFV